MIGVRVLWCKGPLDTCDEDSTEDQQMKQGSHSLPHSHTLARVRSLSLLPSLPPSLPLSRCPCSLPPLLSLSLPLSLLVLPPSLCPCLPASLPPSRYLHLSHSPSMCSGVFSLLPPPPHSRLCLLSRALSPSPPNPPSLHRSFLPRPLSLSLISPPGTGTGKGGGGVG